MTHQERINEIMREAHQGFLKYKELPRARRVEFIYAIAEEIEALGEGLLETAHSETHLGLPRLRAERARTCHQLRSYADAAGSGYPVEAKIDRGDPNRNPPKPDLRKMNVPLGPVVVFGASNFPLAYSTAGGDTASALAAGCSVVVKAHPAHPRTSDMVAEAILRAAERTGMPAGVFGHIHGVGNETGAMLVQHPYTKAVGFTGSFSGGKALFDLANARPEPIPVFAEMGSVNPVYLFPLKLEDSAEEIAKIYAASITLGMGQFCTNPGILVGIDSPGLDRFAHALGGEIQRVSPEPMLHQVIAKGYYFHREKALEQRGVYVLAESEIPAQRHEGLPTVAIADARSFLTNPQLQQEVFGPFSLIVRCQSEHDMKQVALKLRGQLTSSVMAHPKELANHGDLVSQIQEGCGRLIFNGVPTGVEVTLAQHHGGPYPATTDSRFTSVGADAILRFVRPVTFQNWPDELLPGELQDGNPLGIRRV